MDRSEDGYDLSRPLISTAPRQQPATPETPIEAPANKFVDWLKIAGGFVLFGTLMVGALLVISFGIDGLAWLSVKALPWLFPVTWIGLAASLLILLPLAIPRATRTYAAFGMIIVSYLFGLTLWLFGLLVTYLFWGGWAVIVGLILLGIGVVPIALLASIFEGEWPVFFGLLVLTVATFGFRGGGAMLLDGMAE